MTLVAGAPVVVGADGSERGLTAVGTAADEAARRHRPLRIVHAFARPPAGWAVPSSRQPSWLPARDRAEACVAEAAEVAAKLMPAGAIATDVVAGDPAAVLAAVSRQAVLLVLGDRRPGRVSGPMAVRAAADAACPVLVVRGRSRLDGPVVVGVDGSAGSTAALEFAAQEAEWRGTDLVALHAGNGGDGPDPTAGRPMTYEFRGGPAEQNRVLAEAVAGIAERHPDLTVRGRVGYGSARRMLQHLSATAQLIVVGGGAGAAGVLLGSVSRHLVQHSGCPTAVVRPALSGATW